MNLDVNWMLRELGLMEILFDPPPRRASASGGEEDSSEGWDEDTRVAGDVFIGRETFFFNESLHNAAMA